MTRRLPSLVQVHVTIGQLETVRASLHTSVVSAVAAVLVAAQHLPAKIGGVVRALMESVQREVNVDLQRRSALALVGLLRLCAGRSPCPNDKIIKNLCVFLCEDASYTPLCVDAPESVEGVTMEAMTQEPATDEAVLAGDDDALRERRIKKRGASIALQEIARGLGATVDGVVGGDGSGGVFRAVPKLWALTHAPVSAAFGQGQDVAGALFAAAQAQEIVDALQVVSACRHSQLQTLNPIPPSPNSTPAKLQTRCCGRDT